MPSRVTDELPEQRILEQSVRLPRGGAVTGWASLRLHRGAFFDGLAPDGKTRLPVPLAVGSLSKMRGDGLVQVSREPLDPSEVVVVNGIPCTAVRRALFDEIRRTRELREAVVAMDMAAAALLVSIRRMREYLAARGSWRRSSLVQRALGLASERSRSPQETRTRMIWELDAGFPRPLVNQEVRDLRGRLLGIADLLDVEAGLVGEFDGADHRSAVRHTRDLDREGGFRRAGLEVFRVTGIDVLHPGRVVERMRFHRSAARWLPPENRLWTVELPRGTQREQTLDEYLDERDFLREVYQSYEDETPDIHRLRGW